MDSNIHHQHFLFQTETSTKKTPDRQIFIQTVLQSDKSLRKYTGITTKKFLYGIFDIVETNISSIYYWQGSKSINDRVSSKPALKPQRPKKELTNFQEYLLTLVYIRQGFEMSVLADFFQISSSWVCSILKTWINILATVLKELLIYPSAAQVRAWLPPDYPHEYSATRVILDCTEFYITTPGNTSSQAATFSNYKHHNTVKALIGVTPTGVITFVSKVYGGNTSDRHIFKTEFVSKIESGDAVMVDKGFNVADLTLQAGAQLHMPPFTRAKSGGKGRTLNQSEIQKTRDIARLRIHVERAIRRMKEFKLIGNTFDTNLFPLLDQILISVAVLCNFAPPLVAN